MFCGITVVLSKQHIIIYSSNLKSQSKSKYWTMDYIDNAKHRTDAKKGKLYVHFFPLDNCFFPFFLEHCCSTNFIYLSYEASTLIPIYIRVGQLFGALEWDIDSTEINTKNIE